MMTFIFKRSYGKARFYGGDDASKAIIETSGRKCLDLEALKRLEAAGFLMRIKDDVTGAEQNFTGWAGIGRSLEGGTK
jgi:hypothetical protein